MMKRLAILSTVLALLAVACGGGDDDTGTTAAPTTGTSTSRSDAAAGKPLYAGTCETCHGPDAKGIEGLGKKLVASEFIDSKSDAELVEFIKVGRDTSDPLNTTGVAMLPKGGNTSLSDDNLFDIVAYIRSLK